MNNQANHTKPLLSICIPTYNRIDILSENISTLISHPSFDENVQLVIGDNASNDGTQKLIEEFIKNNSDKNIKYYKNDSNIKDKNFFKVLTEGDGIYCKLLNDYTTLSEDDLSKIIEKIKRYKDYDHSTTHLSFIYKIRDISDNIDELKISNINDYILTLNNKLTWTSNFGCFKDQLCELEQYDKYSDLLMLQLFWSLHLAKTRSNIIVCNIKHSSNIPLPNSKRSNPYNFFTPHVVNYYFAINYFAKLSPREIKYDKTRLLTDFVGEKIYTYLILRKKNPFNLKGSWNIIFKHFYNVPYFYKLIPLKISKSLITKTQRLFKWKQEK